MSLIYFFGNLPLDYLPQRSEYLARGLSERAHVVYIEPHRSWIHRRIPTRIASGSLRQFTPPAGWPFARSIEVLHLWNCRRTFAALHVWERRHGLTGPDAIVATFPDQLPLVRSWPNTPLVYDIMDEPDLFMRPRQKPRCLAWHGELLARADATVVSSTTLRSRYQGSARRLMLIGNGVPSGLSQEIDEGTVLDELASLTQPRLGYLGTIGTWFDMDAIRVIAKAFPEGRVILAGPVQCRLGALPGNVILTGPIARERIPRLIRCFDVGLIPFRPSREIDAVNPVKLYEYAAAGLPIVASAFAEMERFRDLVFLYRSGAEAVDAVRAALLSRAARREELKAFARQHTWSRKSDAYWNVVQAAVERRNEIPLTVREEAA